MPKRPKRAQDYASLVAEAERAVAAVKDPELRQVAFSKVLDTLLRPASEGAAVPKPGASADKKAAGERASAKREKSAKRRGPQTYVEELIDDGFFGTQRTIAEVKAELGNRGHHIALTSLSGPLQKLCQSKRLRRQKKTHGKRQTYAYSNW